MFEVNQKEKNKIPVANKDKYTWKRILQFLKKILEDKYFLKIVLEDKDLCIYFKSILKYKSSI